MKKAAQCGPIILSNKATGLITAYMNLSLLIHIHPHKILEFIIRPVVIRIDHIEQTRRDLMFFYALGDAQTASFFMFCRMQRTGIMCTGAMRT